MGRVKSQHLVQAIRNRAEIRVSVREISYLICNEDPDVQEVQP